MSNKVLQFPIFEQADLSRFCQCLYLSASHQGVDEARAQRLVQGFEGLVQKVGYSLAQPVEIFFISKNQFLLQCTGGETIKSDYFKTTLIDEGVVVEFDVLTFDSDVLNFFSIRSERQQLLQLENLNRQLEAKNQEFKTLFKRKKNLLDFLAHEVKNPLNVILGFAELLQLSSDERSQKTGVKISKVSHDVLKLLQEALDSSRIESGKMPIECEDFLASALVHEVADYAKHLVEQKGLTWVCSNELKEGTLIYGDFFRVKQILLNFINNALKFTESGSISFRLADEADFMCLSISDSGRGMEPDFLEEVFKRHSQSSIEDSRGCSGSGLGLSISFGLAKAMNGNLGVESKLGLGSCFTLRLPKS